MTKKYEFTGETKELYGRTLNRIRAIKDFGNVDKGELGGWIEKEENLSHEGNCWVYDDAMAYDDAEVGGNAKIYGSSKVYGKAKIVGNAKIFSNVEVFGKAKVYDDAELSDDAKVYDDACAFGSSKIYGKAKVYGKSWVYDKAWVSGEANLLGEAWVFGNSMVSGNAKLEKTDDTFSISPLGSENEVLTAYKTQDAGIEVKKGFFYGTLKEFEEAVEKTHGDDEHGKTYKVVIQLIKLKLG